MAGSTLTAAALAFAVLILGATGGAGGGAGGPTRRRPSGAGSGASVGHPTAGRLSTGAPANQDFYTGPGAWCTLAPRSRYLPAWSGCVTARIADVFGNGSKDLVLTYSRLGHTSVGEQPAVGKHGSAAKLYRGEQAMLRIITPVGRMSTTPIRYTFAASSRAKPQVERAFSAAIVAAAHVRTVPGEEIFLQIQSTSSGSIVEGYGAYRGRLVPAGALLGDGGDSGAQSSFQCVAGNPPHVIQHAYVLLQGIKVLHGITIYGRWQVTTTTYAWRGPRLVQISQSTAKRLLAPNDSIGSGCTRGVT
ncbi:MAG: hypothetical protein M0T77_10240 [Actinomycetota bacterium]|nr:hypothetical protein [Actinomycetota bacterium]